jgi:hypothetical protein
MNARFEDFSRCSAAGLTTAAALLVMLVMGASTLLSHSTNAPESAAARQAQVAQSHGAHPKKS